MCHIESDGDVLVRKCAVEILLSLAQTCSPLCFMDLIDIVEKVCSDIILDTSSGTFSFSIVDIFRLRSSCAVTL